MKMTLMERMVAYVGERFIRWATGEGATQLHREDVTKVIKRSDNPPQQ